MKGLRALFFNSLKCLNLSVWGGSRAAAEMRKPLNGCGAGDEKKKKKKKVGLPRHWRMLDEKARQVTRKHVTWGVVVVVWPC